MNDLEEHKTALVAEVADAAIANRPIAQATWDALERLPRADHADVFRRITEAFMAAKERIATDDGFLPPRDRSREIPGDVP